MNQKQTKEAIKVMEHFANGGKVECRYRFYTKWEKKSVFADNPNWDWQTFEYRIKKS